MMDRTSVPRPVLDRLGAIAGPDSPRLAQDDLAGHARDATPPVRARPDAGIAPAGTGHAARILRLAPGRRIPVMPRGPGTRPCAGTVPVTGGIVLPAGRMNRLSEVAPQQMLARAQTTVTMQALSAAAAARGLSCQPGPGSRTVSAIGGGAAACRCGKPRTPARRAVLARSQPGTRFGNAGRRNRRCSCGSRCS